jgi:putative solute:sodium symporter small subunit
MAAQGSLIVFVITIFWSTSRQEKIDEKYGVAEEDQ